MTRIFALLLLVSSGFAQERAPEASITPAAEPAPSPSPTPEPSPADSLRTAAADLREMRVRVETICRLKYGDKECTMPDVPSRAP